MSSDEDKSESSEHSSVEEIEEKPLKKGKRIQLTEAISNNGKVTEVKRIDSVRQSCKIREPKILKPKKDFSSDEVRSELRSRFKEGSAARVDKKKRETTMEHLTLLEEKEGDDHLGYVYLKSGKASLYETPSKKYYTLKKDRNGKITKNYVTKRIKEGKLDIYEK